MQTRAKGILILMILSLVLFGAGCAEKDEPEASNSTVNLSQGKILEVSVKAWREFDRDEVITVEIDVKNTGDDTISIGYMASFFDNREDPITRNWDSGKLIIDPRETGSFFIESDCGSKDFFRKTDDSPANFCFSLTTEDGNEQTIICKGKALIPWLEEGKSRDIRVKRTT